jgi:hypothetical protein
MFHVERRAILGYCWGFLSENSGGSRLGPLANILFVESTLPARSNTLKPKKNVMELPTMPFEYLNRRDQLYYIRVAEGRNGKLCFTLTTSRAGRLADEIPDGMEIHEIPETGQAVLRKKRPTQILELEREALRQAVARQTGEGMSLVEVEAKALVVYLNDVEQPDEPDLWRAYVRRMARRDARYSKLMRFELAETRPRQFTVSRWCFLGSIDTWFPLDGPAPLTKLMEKYVKHLGKASFFELMGWPNR